jgi:predicted hydrocarbon binding protein
MRHADSADRQKTHRWQDYQRIKQAVLDALSDSPQGLTGAKLARIVGITPGSMSKYLSMLNVDGVIVSQQVGVAKLWRAVSSSDRTDLLAMSLSSATLNFKDYVLSIIEKDGTLFDPDNKRILTVPVILLVSLYRHTETILGTEVHAFFYEWGRSYTIETKNLVKTIAEKAGSNFIWAFLSLLQIEGWGRFVITSMSDQSVEVIWHDSFWTNVDGERKGQAVDDFLVGALVEATALSSGGNWRFSEIECKSTGAPHCRFTGVRVK